MSITQRTIKGYEFEELKNQILEEVKFEDSYMRDWLDLYENAKDLNDIMTAIIYTIQQGTSYFCEFTAPILKKTFLANFEDTEVHTYKGLKFLKSDIMYNGEDKETLVKKIMNPWEEFVSTSSNIDVAKKFATSYGLNTPKLSNDYIGLVLELSSKKSFIVDKKTRDFGESEVILHKPTTFKILEVIEL